MNMIGLNLSAAQFSEKKKLLKLRHLLLLLHLSVVGEGGEYKDSYETNMPNTIHEWKENLHD